MAAKKSVNAEQMRTVADMMPGRRAKASEPSGVIATSGVTAPEAHITVHYEGRAVPARPGSSIAAALTAAGIRACRQSEAGDRGLFCGMGVCGECSIEVDGSAGQLACMTAADDGMRLRRQPTAPRADLTTGPEPRSAEEVLHAEVVVVGGGPAGLAAAATAAEAGADVLLVDDRAGLGGQYYKQPASSFILDPAALDQQYAAGRALIQRVRAAGVRVQVGRPGLGRRRAGPAVRDGRLRPLRHPRGAADSRDRRV